MDPSAYMHQFGSGSGQMNAGQIPQVTSNIFNELNHKQVLNFNWTTNFTFLV